MNRFKRSLFSISAGALLLNACDSIVEPRTITGSASPDLAPTTTESWPGVFDPYTMLSLYLEMEPANWDVVRQDVTNSIELPAMFNGDGEVPIAVTVRRKSSRALPSEENPIKVGLKVKTVSGRWHGVTTLSLENGADVGPVAEGLAWNMHEMASIDGFYGEGYHPALASWVKLYVNGEYIGVYVNVEQRNKQFLRNRFGTTNGIWFYEIDDINGFELEAGEPHSPTYDALCFAPFQSVKRQGGGSCALPSDEELESTLNDYIDMRAMLVQGAIDAFSDNPDALFSHGKNYFFLDFAAGQRRSYYPWDLDAVFRKVDANIYGAATGKNRLLQSSFQDVILNHPAFRQQYNEIMLALIAPDGPLATDRLHTFIDAVQATIQAALNADPYVGEYGSPEEFSGLKSWLSQRAPIVRAQIDANLPAPRQ